MKSLVAICTLYLFFYGSCFTQSSLKQEFTLSTDDGLQLAGEIEYPSKKGKYPAAILIWGSGPHTRDQIISGTPIFKQIKDELIKEDMVIMRMDKRGYGKSSGNFKSEVNYSTRDLADDIKVAYEYLNKQSFVDTSKVGLIGHSEGSIIASMLGAEDKSIDWIIVFGPSSVSGKEIEIDQGQVQRERLGMNEEISKKVEMVWEKYIEFIKTGYENDSLYYQIGKEFLMAHGMEENDERITHKFIDQLLDGYKTPWYQYFYSNDNAKHIEKIKIPYLAIFGGADKHTSLKLNFFPMYEALQRANNKQYKMVVIADDDHFFFRYKGQRLDKHKNGEMQMSHEFIWTIKAWLKEFDITEE